MDEQTVPDPPYGSVESYVQLLRHVVRSRDFLDTAALGFVRVIVGDDMLPDSLKVARIENVLAAAVRVGSGPEAGR